MTLNFNIFFLVPFKVFQKKNPHNCHFACDWKIREKKLPQQFFLSLAKVYCIEKYCVILLVSFVVFHFTSETTNNKKSDKLNAHLSFVIKKLNSFIILLVQQFKIFPQQIIKKFLFFYVTRSQIIEHNEAPEYK